MEAMYAKQRSLGLGSHDVYEVRPRKDGDGVDLISDAVSIRPDLVCRA